MARILDTNVISELIRVEPDKNVVHWVANADESQLYLTSTTIAEIARGVWRLPEGRRRASLEIWLIEELLPRFRGRILAFDEDAALAWGRLMGAGEQAGRTPADRDCQIAAIALHRGMDIATRNVRDFESFAVSIVNPWKPPSTAKR